MEEELTLPSADKQRNARLMTILVTVIAVVWSLYQVYVILQPAAVPLLNQRVLHLAFGITLLYLLKPAAKGTRWGKYVRILDMAGLAAYWVTTIWVAVNHDWIELHPGTWSDLMIVGAIIGIVMLLEATRRAMGATMVWVSVAFLLFALFGRNLPGVFRHPGFDWRLLTGSLWHSTDGVFGSVLGVSTTYVFVFILYGAFLFELGAGHFLTDLAMSVFGGVRGGPAKMAVVASALFGTISGSTTANVVTTGTVTIPLMKRTGFQPEFAAAVEAAAAVGGQLMPPVMGATAFIMASIMGVPYSAIVVAAIIPAVLYYLNLFLGVDFESGKRGLKGLPREQLPNFWKVLRAGWRYMVSFGLLMYLMMVQNFSPEVACVWALFALVAIRLLEDRSKANLKACGKALVQGALNAVTVTIACGVVGIIMGVTIMSGAGLRISAALLALTGGSLFLLLLFTMIASLVLGSGLPTSATYIILVILALPPLVDSGVPPMAAHMFLFYFGVLADISPPVAVTAYIASGLAEANPEKTGMKAMALSVAGFISPFIFVYRPAMLLPAPWLDAVLATLFGGVGVVAVSGFLHGYLLRRLSWLERGLLILAAVGLLTPGVVASYTGLAVAAVLFLGQAVPALKEPWAKLMFASDLLASPRSSQG